jgi:hypothetical protein
MRLFCKTPPLQKGGANFFNDSVRATAFHASVFFAQARKSISVNPSRLPFIVI